MEDRCYISKLPCTILREEIFSRLPYPACVACKCVCKSWCLCFSKLPRLSKNILLCTQGRNLQWVDFKNNVHFSFVAEFLSPNSSRSIMQRRCSPFAYTSVNSCNGLLSVCTFPSEDFKDVVMHILNPITEEYLTLPGRNDTRVGLHKDLCGLGFCPETKRFKAFRLSYHLLLNERNSCQELRRQAHRDFYQVEVFTLGTDSAWRNIGPARNYRCSGKAVWGSFKAFLSGSIHRLIVSHEGLEISAFDFEKEQFRSIQLPHAFDKMTRKKCGYTDIGVYKDSLCFCCLERNKVPEALEVWVMKEYGVAIAWQLKLVVRSSEESWQWKMQKPINVVMFFDNDCILLSDGGRLVLYDPQRGRHAGLADGTEDEYIHAICFNNPRFDSLNQIVGSSLEIFDATKLLNQIRTSC
ncbi:hypothetical protein Tsubulata_014484 [Turnera subulata]|uniref:F-box domain-containing protein n=1 Tax=Turnera subulata TaxID=218843 RepID=A0A9Q0GME8_9ROSI|nr:hypothetical protein Tsubulata_014484 [Turnera subulata]